jgi:phospholipid transport system substrate-binding protein
MVYLAVPRPVPRPVPRVGARVVACPVPRAVACAVPGAVSRVVSRRAVLGAVFAGLAVAPGRGWAQGAAPVVEQVTAPVQALNDGLVAAMRAGKSASFRQRFDSLAPTIDRAFDLAGILRASVGLRWSDFDAAQQDRLAQVFRRFTIASYVGNFDSYNGQRFTIAPTLRATGADQVVGTTLQPANGDSVRIDYVMRQEAAGWKIVDVLLDGTISRVAVQRSDFRGLLAQGGAPALTASLEQKVVALAGSSLDT